MALRLTARIGIIGLALLVAPTVAGDLTAFERSFEDSTLRVDYDHGGNAVTEFAAWDRSIRQGIWAGSRVHLIDPFAVGRTLVEVRDAETGDLLFSKRSDSYFAEYRTTAVALAGVERVYHESALIPFPKRKVQFSVGVRGKDRVMKTLLTRVIDPADPASISTEALRPGVVVVDAHIGGDPHACVDVAIVGEGYTPADEAKFRTDLARYSDVLLGQEPYQSHRDRFNVRGVWAASVESGCDEPARGVWRDTAVGARFDSLGSERYLLTEDNQALRAIAAHVPYDSIFIMVNSPRYGGGGIYNLFCAFTADNQWSPYVFLHEFGHSFASLADEYYSSNVAYTDFFPKGVEPIEPNITALLDPKKLKWADLVFPGISIPTPWGKDGYDEDDNAYQKRREELNKAITAASRNSSSGDLVAKLKAEAEAASRAQAEAVDARLTQSSLAGKVGAFEGAGYSSQGFYRPALDCIMFSRGEKPYCPVCVRAIHQTMKAYGEDDGTVPR